jgi:histidine phosphotransferase ChpT
MTHTGSPDVNALIGSRICHDLISPLGAIGNGLELLEMMSNSSGPEFDLIRDSVQNAHTRIRVFRLAFGAASADAVVKGSEVSEAATAMFTGPRLNMTCDLPKAIRRVEAKLALLLVMCVETALPRGGEITLTCADAGWTIHATGERIDTDPAVWGQMAEAAPAPGLSAAEVQFALVPGALRAAGRRLQTDLTDGAIRLTF